MAINNTVNRSTSGVNEDALSTTTAGDTVRNSAKLTTTGDLADGIYAGADNVGIRNLGQIETSGLGAAGILVQGNDARVTNYGSIVTHGSLSDPDPNVSGGEFYSEGMTVIGDRFNIANFGTVHVEGEQASGMSGIGADGVLVNNYRVEGAGHGSSLMAVFGARAQAINNSLITVSTEGNSGMFAVGAEASALNRGRIEMTAAHSVGMEGVFADTKITNTGTIKISGDASVGICGLGDGHELINRGDIDMHGFFSMGMEASGLGQLGANLLNTGHIDTVGDLAIGIALGVTNTDPAAGFVPNRSPGGEITNRGIIETSGDGAAGVAMVGNDNHLLNTGRITTDGGEFASLSVGPFRAAGVVVSGSGVVVDNSASGIIQSKDAGSAAVELNVVQRDGFLENSATSLLDNKGQIKGADVAVLGDVGQETVINHGRIIGDVVLGDNDDTFVFGKGGSLKGDLLLGGGHDLVVVENGAGKVTVADFHATGDSSDVVDVSDFFSGFSALLAKSAQAVNDVVITLDSNDSLILTGVQLADLTASDFLFV